MIPFLNVSLTDLTLYWFIMSIIVTPLIAFLFIRGNKFKRFVYWLTRKSYINVLHIDDSGYGEVKVHTTEREGTRSFIQDGNNKYGNEPLCRNYSVVENGNALPVVRGGYIEKKVVTQALAQEIEGQSKKTLADLSKPENQSIVKRVYEWAIEKGKLRNCIIRPFVKWSSRELDEAIGSRVIHDLLHVSPELVDFLFIIGFIAIMGLTFYFGYTNQEVMRDILEILANPPSPITPV